MLISLNKGGGYMKYISEKEYNSRMKQIEQMNKVKERKQKLREAKNKYRIKFKLPTTSKLMAAYLFAILNVVLIYAMVAMWHFQDLTYLGVLITDVAAQVLTYFIYSKKATIENTVGGITYDMALKSVDEVTVYKNDETGNVVG